MSSTFGGITRAQSGLTAAQRGLDVTGQNISNLNTDGYSRQRAELQSIGGSVVPAYFSRSGMVGDGVTVDSVTRIRDTFLENRAQAEHASSARLTATSDSLTEVEAAFREPGDTGIQSQMAKVWAAFGSVALKSDDIGARNNLLQTAQTLVGGIQTTRASLDTQWSNTYTKLTALVSDANTTIGQISQLNDSIVNALHGGLPTNDLADKRDVLVQKLATDMGATSSPGQDGALNVRIGGTIVVAKGIAVKLAVAGPNTVDAVHPASTGDLATPAAPQIVLSPSGSPLGVDGTAGGLLGALGPSVTQGTSIVSYRGQLDDFAASLAATINAQQAVGYDLDGKQDAAIPGGRAFFVPSSGTVITAKNITLGITDPRGVAAAKYGPVGGVASTDNQNAGASSQLGKPPSSPDATYRSLITNLGVSSSVSTRNADIQTVIAGQVDSARESVAGVSQDEELTNMLQFQHAYAAAGRMITAIDEMLDTLINRTGLVGR